MMFDVAKWGEFSLDKLFVFENCKCNVARDLSDGNDCYYIGAKKNDNGVMRKVAYDKDLITRGNCIVFICDGQGSVGYSNYMDKDFIGSTTLTIGRNSQLNKYTGMFLVAVLDLERPKYSFGRKYRTKLKSTTIKLPKAADGSPDWNYMEQYIQFISTVEPLKTKNKKQKTKNKEKDSSPFETEMWKEFKVGDLFRLERCKNSSSANLLEGNDCYYLGAKKNNNGVMRCAKRDDGLMTKGNCIIFIGNGQGSVGYTNYMNEDFIGTADLTVGYNENLNQYVGLFIVTLLDLERPKYSFGRKWSARIANTIIKLPAKGNSPDWAYMESYIKSLPYGDRI